VLRRYVRLPGSVDEAFVRAAFTPSTVPTALMIDYTAGNPDGGEDGQEFFTHQNRLGSTIATTDSNGNVIDQYTYSPTASPEPTTPASPSVTPAKKLTPKPDYIITRQDIMIQRREGSYKQTQLDTKINRICMLM